MKAGELKSNPICFRVQFAVCTCIAGIEEGKHIHNQIIKSGLDSDIFVGIALLHMYGKFGCGYIKNVFVGIYWLRFLLTMGMFYSQFQPIPQRGLLPQLHNHCGY